MNYSSAVPRKDSKSSPRVPVTDSVIQSPTAAEKTKAGVLVWLFFWALISPVFIDLGPFGLPLYRLILIFTVVPCMIMWILGRLGPIRIADLLVLAFTIWAAVCMVFNHGLVAQYEFIGFTFVDTAGGYFLGRALIRNAATFLGMVKVHLITLVFLMPFAMLETQTGAPLLIELLQPYIRTQPVIDHEVRLGLERAQTVFQHPILFGIYAAGILGSVFFGLGFRASKLSTVLRTTVVTVCTICSVSSGAFLALIIQVAFIIYERVMSPRAWRWKVILLLVAIFYILTDLVTNRSVVQIVIANLTLNPSTGFNRIRIWEYGTQNVAANPIFGLGLRDWVRPAWMVASLDNFWLLVAMRYGYPGIFLYLGAFLLLLWQLGTAKSLSALTTDIRRGVLISLGGVMIAAITVSLWGPIYSWLMFTLGGIVWILEENSTRQKNLNIPVTGAAPVAASEVEQGNSQIVYSRFSHKNAQDHGGGR